MAAIQHKPTHSDIQKHVRDALREDLGGRVNNHDDITASLIPAQQTATATIITREDMVMCGLDWVYETCQQVDNTINITAHVKDGQRMSANALLFTLVGNARVLLTAERTLLNFIQFLSATATTTYNYVQYIKHSQTRLLDTRKTIPGFRLAQKYAVACGGGSNHRVGVYDAFLIKENHIAACGGITAAINQAKTLAPNKTVEVEVETFIELEEATRAGADIIMLDNFSTEQVKSAVAFVNRRCKLEVSGNITYHRLTELCNTGVDYISSGALTKTVQAIDLSMRLSVNKT